MIDVLTRDNESRFSGCLESMFRLRYEVFVQRLGWILECRDGMEMDQFDNELAVYLVLRNNENEVLASARLLPMSGPTLLGDVFPFLIEGIEIPSTPDIWEVTRVAVDHRKTRIDSVRRCGSVAGTLFCAIFEFALAMGLTHLVSVSDTRMERILVRKGWRIERLGSVHHLDGIDAVGEITEVNEDALAHMQDTNGIDGSVLNRPFAVPSPVNVPERRAA